MEISEDNSGLNNDFLGAILQKKYDQWNADLREVHEEWLRDLRAFNQINDPGVEILSQFHSHIYVGITRTKCLTAYARIVDLMFQSSEKHWAIAATPVPESNTNPQAALFLDEMKERAALMESDMEDKLVDIGYEDVLKPAILEGCIIGTGCVKGVIPGVKTHDSWMKVDDGWIIVHSEEPAPEAFTVSVFDVVPDPFATRVEDMSGVFERHVLNRQQLSDLKNNPKFDSSKIDEVLSSSDKGTHQPLFHETERRKIAGLTDSPATGAERYDVLEYWGQCSGKSLSSAGLELEDDTATYWCNVWTLSGKTILAKVMPMAKQQIPYNFFRYERVPHQFWGISPARMMRDSQATLNGTIRTLLDNMAIASGPIVEVNTNMIRKSDSPVSVKPWQIILRDAGDPSDPALRFYQAKSLVSELTNMADTFRKHADEETALPSFTHGEQIPGLTKTASGISMLMGAANISTKNVIRNLEELIKRFLTSLFDWEMQWNDNEEIKGDMTVDVRGSSALIAKETQSQRLIQFLQLTANPLDAPMVDRRYLLREAANSFEIDAAKAVPDPDEGFNGTIPSESNPELMLENGMGGTPGSLSGQIAPPA